MLEIGGDTLILPSRRFINRENPSSESLFGEYMYIYIYIYPSGALVEPYWLPTGTPRSPRALPRHSRICGALAFAYLSLAPTPR